MDNSDNELLVDLQTKLAFQDQALSELNEVLVHQQQTIEALQKQLQALNDKLMSLEENLDTNAGINEADEKPPHY